MNLERVTNYDSSRIDSGVRSASKRRFLKKSAATFGLLALGACGGPKEIFNDPPEQKESRETGVKKNRQLHDADKLANFAKLDTRHRHFLNESLNEGKQISDALPKYALELFNKLNKFKGSIHQGINFALGQIIRGKQYPPEQKAHAIALVQKINEGNTLEKMWDDLTESLKKSLPQIVPQLLHGTLAFYDDELISEFLTQLTGRNIAATIDELLTVRTAEQITLNRYMIGILTTGKIENIPVMLSHIIIYAIAANLFPSLNKNIGGKSRLAFAAGYANLRASNNPFTADTEYDEVTGSYASIWYEHTTMHALIQMSEMPIEHKLSLIKGEFSDESLKSLAGSLKIFLDGIVNSYEMSDDKENHPFHSILSGSPKYMQELKRVLDNPVGTIKTIWQKSAAIFTEKTEENTLTDEASQAFNDARTLDQLLNLVIFQDPAQETHTICKTGKRPQRATLQRLPVPENIGCLTVTRV